jgi:hypothetical protein
MLLDQLVLHQVPAVRNSRCPPSSAHLAEPIELLQLHLAEPPHVQSVRRRRTSSPAAFAELFAEPFAAGSELTSPPREEICRRVPAVICETRRGTM